jgi:hypothetical protein
MPQKKVVLCEGIREAILVSVILDQNKRKNKIIPHEEFQIPGESPENDRIKWQATESIKIHEFLGRKGQFYSFLIKDEGGDTKCIDAFVILYMDKDERFEFVVLVDSPALEYLKGRARKVLSRDILDKVSNNFYLTKDKTKHHIFFTPNSLESQIRHFTGKNIDYMNRKEARRVLRDFKIICERKKIEWFLELEKALLS